MKTIKKLESAVQILSVNEKDLLNGGVDYYKHGKKVSKAEYKAHYKELTGCPSAH